MDGKPLKTLMSAKQDCPGRGLLLREGQHILSS